MEKETGFGIIFVVAILIVFAIGFLVVNSKVKPDNTDIISIGGGFGFDENLVQDSPVLHTIKITSSGFSPNTLTINKEDIVLFVNEGSSPSWPASAMHPTHTVYDGTTMSEHCPNPENTAFDSCEGIEEGESWSFTFEKTGTWNYHDHLNVARTGTIVVN
jgi:plastocyanin